MYFITKSNWLEGHGRAGKWREVCILHYQKKGLAVMTVWLI
jgi:hypothetical protein